MGMQRPNSTSKTSPEPHQCGSCGCNFKVKGQWVNVGDTEPWWLHKHLIDFSQKRNLG